MKLTKKELEVIKNYIRTTNNPYEYEIIVSKNGGYNWLESRTNIIKKLAEKTDSDFKVIREYDERYNNVIVLEITDPLSQTLDNIIKGGQINE